MSQKHLVCNGAICQCTFGTTPDKLKVKQTDYYINEKAPAQKSIANTLDIGQPFEANTFGSCKKMNNNACKPAITEWQGFYDKVTLQNGGKVLLEDSKGICAVAGTACVEFTFHGQTAEMGSDNLKKADQQTVLVLCPLLGTGSAIRQTDHLLS